MELFLNVFITKSFFFNVATVDLYFYFGSFTCYFCSVFWIRGRLQHINIISSLHHSLDGVNHLIAFLKRTIFFLFIHLRVLIYTWIPEGSYLEAFHFRLSVSTSSSSLLTAPAFSEMPRPTLSRALPRLFLISLFLVISIAFVTVTTFLREMKKKTPRPRREPSTLGVAS